MKPTHHNVRPKGWIPFANYAIVDRTPETIRLQDHMFPYKGAKPDERFLWGLYGTMSANLGLFMAEGHANKVKKHSLTLQGWYRVDEYELSRSQIDEQIVSRTGFLHLDRLRKGYREEVHDQLLAAAEATIPGFRRQIFADKSLSDLVVAYPSVVRELIDSNRKINLVVHPARQTYDEHDTRLLSVATMRHVKSRVMDVQVLYQESIKVTY